LPVGTEFFGKAEMAVCGMHHSWLSGIDYGKVQGETVALALGPWLDCCRGGHNTHIAKHDLNLYTHGSPNLRNATMAAQQEGN